MVMWRDGLQDRGYAVVAVPKVPKEDLVFCKIQFMNSIIVDSLKFLLGTSFRIIRRGVSEPVRNLNSGQDW